MIQPLSHSLRLEAAARNEAAARMPTKYSSCMYVPNKEARRFLSPRCVRLQREDRRRRPSDAYRIPPASPVAIDTDPWTEQFVDSIGHGLSTRKLAKRWGRHHKTSSSKRFRAARCGEIMPRTLRPSAHPAPPKEIPALAHAAPPACALQMQS